MVFGWEIGLSKFVLISKNEIGMIKLVLTD